MLRDWSAALKLLLLGIACLLAYSVSLSVAVVGPALVAGLAAILAQNRWIEARPLGPRILSGLAWIATAMTIAFALLPGSRFYVEVYVSIMVWLTAMAFFPLRAAVRVSAEWKKLGMTWILLGIVIWIASGYAENRAITFYCGMLFLIAWLIALQLLWKLPAALRVGANSLILLNLGLPLASWLTHPKNAASTTAFPEEELYLYESARTNQPGFNRWCGAFDEQWHKVLTEAFLINGGYRLRPNSHSVLFESPIAINSLGFRGSELSNDTNVYRIVALGESTTFGITIRSNDCPWPELLQQLIESRIHPARPVEVVNAGIPALTLPANLDRLTPEILPLKPNLIISYHGYNGFYLLRSGLSIPFVIKAPHYQKRPIRLLADIEYKMRLALAVRSEKSMLALNPPDTRKPLDTPYAEAYRRLIEVARSNHVHLALCNYSMAVNSRSPFEVIQFFQRRFATAFWQVKANDVHSMIVRELTRQTPDVLYVDTHPGLDGDYDEFIDLMHFAHAGEAQIAENIYQGIETFLRQELGSSGSTSNAFSAASSAISADSTRENARGGTF
ncbi:MAG: hypothetical protein U1F98_00755 [Verrucomicrobiota bacterium]